LNFFNSVSGPRSRNDDKSRRPLWPFVSVLLFCIVFFGYRAAVENDSASRQQTSFGTIAQCEHRGRGNENYCHYTFPVGDEQYAGVSKAEQGAGFGQTATRAEWTVYFEADPDTLYMDDIYAIDTIQASGAKLIWVTPRMRAEWQHNPKSRVKLGKN
jgi:hypothetical protein